MPRPSLVPSPGRRHATGVVWFVTVFAITGCAAGNGQVTGSLPGVSRPSVSSLASPGTTPTGSGSRVGAFVSSSPSRPAAASSSVPGAAVPPIRRGASTRTAPRTLARGIRAGQPVRVASVRIDGTRARAVTVAATGPRETEQRIAEAQADPAVLAVQVDRKVYVALGEDAESREAPPEPTTSPEVTVQPVDDPLRSQQWALDQLAAEPVWTVSRGTGQTIAVIDSGVDATHPDLAGQLLVGTDLVTAGGTGGTDPFGHGTHVAGIIAASAGNHLGIAGLAPGARILPVRVLDSDGAGWESDIAAGVLWAVDHGAGVVNLSLGGPDASEAVRTAITIAVSRGVVVVAAAGNERGQGSSVSYPAGFGLPGELAVAATTKARVSAPYSNTGSYVSVAAPGDAILSTLAGSYKSLSGTSMAAPYVSAVVALVRSAAPGLGPVDVVRALTSTADDLEAAGRDDATGSGLVDPGAALCLVATCPPSTTPASPSPSGSPSPSMSPHASPSEGPAVTSPLRVMARVTPATPTYGQTAMMLVTVTDANGPVTGVTLRVAGPGRSASGRTDVHGSARIPISVPSTSTWTVTGTSAGLVVLVRVKVPVAPKVAVRWVGDRATVTVSPARGQAITVTRGSTVRARARLTTAASARVTLLAPASGRVRVTIGATAGLVAVTVTRPPTGIR